MKNKKEDKSRSSKNMPVDEKKKAFEQGLYNNDQARQHTADDNSINFKNTTPPEDKEPVEEKSDILKNK